MSHKYSSLLVRLSLIVSVALLILVTPNPQAQNQATVTVSDANVAENRTETVTLSLQGGPSEGLADFDGELEYDPDVVNVTEVSGSNNYNIAAFRIDNDNGLVRFIGFKVSGELISDGEFVQFGVRAVGNIDDTTRLRLSLRTFSTPENSIDHSVENGRFTVTSTQALDADFTFEPTSPDAGQEIQFTDQSSGGGSIESWQWDFDDGSTSSNRNPTHTYSSGGTYSVELTVEDDRGNTDSTTKQVAVGGGTITFPVRNYPNPAAEQTTFVYELPDGTSAATLHVYTLDGRLAHQTSLNVDQSEYDWNLTDQPEGIYYYRVTATLPSGSAISNVGKLVIAR